MSFSKNVIYVSLRLLFIWFFLTHFRTCRRKKYCCYFLFAAAAAHLVAQEGVRRLPHKHVLVGVVMSMARVMVDSGQLIPVGGVE